MTSVQWRSYHGEGKKGNLSTIPLYAWRRAIYTLLAKKMKKIKRIGHSILCRLCKLNISLLRLGIAVPLTHLASHFGIETPFLYNMAEAKELSANLANYKAQLRQVDAALTTEPDNEELLKLKNDLEEVIALTSDLVEMNEGGGKSGGETSGQTKAKDVSGWKEGDSCQAIWSQDGCYYDATVDKISDDGLTCTVTLEPFGNTEITKVSLLKKVGDSGVKRAVADDSDTEDNLTGKQNKGLSKAEREKLKELKRKKSLKKKQKRKELNEAREREKSKWLDFFNGPKHGTKKKGISKKSIFASPETVEGKVGVGTCGIGGQPMTSFAQPDKLVYRR